MTVRITEHTADLAVDATGDDAGEALAEAALGLSMVVTGRDDLHSIRPDQTLTFEVKAPDKESLAVAFLSEVLWLLESEGLLWLGGGAEVTEDDEGWRAVANGNGIVHDPSIHGQGTEVKAVTYHDLLFEGAKQWRLRVVLDI